MHVSHEPCSVNVVVSELADPADSKKITKRAPRCQLGVFFLDVALHIILVGMASWLHGSSIGLEMAECLVGGPLRSLLELAG